MWFDYRKPRRIARRRRSRRKRPTLIQTSLRSRHPHSSYSGIYQSGIFFGIFWLFRLWFNKEIFLVLCSKEARRSFLQERPGINNSTLNALISVKWKVLSFLLSLLECDIENFWKFLFANLPIWAFLYRSWMSKRGKSGMTKLRKLWKHTRRN